MAHVPPWPEFGIHVVVKPIGPICNLRCRYCFYLEKELLYGSGESWRMSEETLELYIRQYIEATPAAAQEINFTFQGGEPTLMGLDFFRRAVELQRQYMPPGKRIRNSFQTNGLLLDDAWCDFLREKQFLVGLSIDGPDELHDEYRTDALGQGSSERVVSALHLMQKHGVKFNSISCIQRRNAEHPLRVYRFLRDCGVKYMQFIPVVQFRGARGSPAQEKAGGMPAQRMEDWVTPESVLPKQFGNFLAAIFDEWAYNDVGRIQVGDIEQAIMTWFGDFPIVCVHKDICGRALALEHNGDLYACDHFVDPPHKLGNIHESTIARMANSQAQQQFGFAKSTALPSSCRNCEVRFLCNGGCPKDRFLRDAQGEPGLNYLCEGFRMFYKHSAPIMREMASAMHAGCPASVVMRELRVLDKCPRQADLDSRIGVLVKRILTAELEEKKIPHVEG